SLDHEISFNLSVSGHGSNSQGTIFDLYARKFSSKMVQIDNEFWFDHTFLQSNCKIRPSSYYPGSRAVFVEDGQEFNHTLRGNILKGCDWSEILECLQACSLVMAL